jgi:hypothetical protein
MLYMLSSKLLEMKYKALIRDRKLRGTLSHARLKARKNSLIEFKRFLEGLQLYPKWLGIKSSLPSPNLYFFNQSRGILMDFSATFHIVLMPNFIDVFPARVTVA